MIKTTGLSTSRPARAGQSEAAHVEKARSEVRAEGAEKPIKVLAPAKYHKATAELKNMTEDSVPVKHLVLEALDDLFEKYGRGEGRYKVADVAELRRRIDAVMK
jgi:hypothetical protein